VAPRILGIAASPRKGGNTDLLLREVLTAAREAGADTNLVAARDLAMRPCIECNGCQKTGRCVLRDDMTGVFAQLLACDHWPATTWSSRPLSSSRPSRPTPRW